MRNQCSEELGSSGALRGALDLGSTREHFCFLKMLMFYFIFKALNFFFTRLFIFLALCGMRNLSSPTRDRTSAPLQS